MSSLTTRYLGLELDHPIVPGASPMGDDIDQVLRLEDAGACAIVMRSIFEEQVTLDQMAAHRHFDGASDAEARSMMPDTDVYALGLDAYLDQIRRIRARTSLKVIGSINGSSPGGWTDYARRVTSAGAHALELNLYEVASDPRMSAGDVEERQLAVVREVTREVGLPIAVKLSPFYSSLPNFVQALEDVGAKGAVFFNRFYQADIDPLQLEAVRTLRLSSPEELLLRLRWLALVSPRTRLQLAASGGVHAATDVVKAIMAGAQVVQVVSALLKHGAAHLRALITGLSQFLEEQEYPSLDVMRGNMSHARSPNPAAYERADYIQLLSGWHGPMR